jgi:hypothetical protein
MDRLALVLVFLVGFALGKATSPEAVRQWRWWLERRARGDRSKDAAEYAREVLAEQRKAARS